VIHLRIVAPADLAGQVLARLSAAPSVLNVVHLPRAARKPEGDAIFCDVAREDASQIIADLRALRIPERGSIAVEQVESAISDAAARAERAVPGLASDAVVWEEVETTTSEDTELSVSFLAFMVIAMQIAAVGVVLDQPVLIVGAMIVGPEFGPLAALSVAIVQRRAALARRSLAALAVGFPIGILAALGTALVLNAIGLFPSSFSAQDHPLTRFVSSPDALSAFVALVAAAAGVLSLTSAKSGALIGVLISVTTIPAASAIGVGVAYGNWDEVAGAAGQLGINLTAIVLSSVGTLFVQRRWYVSRRRRHLREPIGSRGGLALAGRAHTRLGTPGPSDDPDR
jgi:uncharacterized hydrophobic protein (TIGR00271 family)